MSPMRGDGKFEQLISIVVDPSKYDLSDLMDEAEGDGWARDETNAVYYLAQRIADEHTGRGCQIEVVV